MKKYGLLKYTISASANIGDEIQSLAARQFLPHIDCYIDRDCTSKFADKENVYMILNGWFKQRAFDWPPSSNIHPLFISFHIATHKKGHKILAHPKMKSYYKKFEPIGCRDYHTVRLLRNIGVDAYFSSCLTLTLQNNSRKRSDDIYFVDPFEAKSGYVFPLPGEAGFRNDLWEQFPQHVRDRAIFLTHTYYEKDYTVRLKKAQELIDIYSKAKLVITSRIHCALPCLALGTPVVFINKDESDPRYDGLVELLKNYSVRDIQNNNFDINWDNPEPNPVDVSDRANVLRKSCHEFIEGKRTTDQPINICTAADQNYVSHLPTLLNSISQNTKSCVNFYLLGRNLTPSTKIRLSRLEKSRISLFVLDMGNSLENKNLLLLPHVSPSTMDRLQLSSLLPDIKKVVYLDLNLVVNADLRNLYEMNTSNRGICAKSSIPEEWRTLKTLLNLWRKDYFSKWGNWPNEMPKEFDVETSCFDAEVLLLDLDKMRKHKFEEFIVPLAEKYGINDQLALNIYANGDYAELPPSWNVCVQQDDPTTKNILHWGGPKERKLWGNFRVPYIKYWHRYYAEWNVSMIGRVRKLLSLFQNKFNSLRRRLYYHSQSLYEKMLAKTPPLKRRIKR